VTLYAPFTVSDNKTTVTCPAQPTSLAPGESITCTATYVITEADLSAGSVTNVAQAKAKDAQGKDVVSNNDEETVTYAPLPATLGDWVWFDTNENGVQDEGEEGVAGVKVELYTESGSLVATTTTDSNGGYLFTGLEAGAYYVEFTTPEGYRFTQYDASSNSKDAADSDPLAPTVKVTISDGGVEPGLGESLTYTISYANTDANLVATQVVISVTVPEGTSYRAMGSSPGWSCTDENAGGICTLTLPTVAAGTSGSVNFVVLLNQEDDEVPDQLDMLISVTQEPVGRTDLVTLDAGEDNRTVDAGIILVETRSLLTTMAAGPTDLPVVPQPNALKNRVFLPEVRHSSEGVASSAVQEEVQSSEKPNTFLPAIQSQT
jgi:uncharacterized repeat protein (TIGR01451 family)